MAINTIFLILLNAIATLAVKNSSLTFVIDDTWSMNTEIENVKSGSRSIIDVILNSGSSRIEDLVLVTFNDPGVAFQVRTKDRDEFIKKLDDISVVGGNDCPEMSLTGLELGLNKTRPGSFIFLFTDDGPKDATVERIERIKKLCQEKSSQVVFVVTPNRLCLHANFSSYYEIAQSSTGQVLLLDEKDDVKKIIPYINVMVPGDGTLITSRVLPPSQWIDIHFQIDDQTQYAIASTSGSNVSFQLLDENNEYIDDFDAIVWIKNVKVAKINKPGRYTAQVISKSTASIVILAKTDFTFEPGFSVIEVETFEDTNKQPYEGIQTHLWISVNELKHLIDINFAEILDMNENLIQKLPLKKVYGDVYVTDLFLTPNSMFKVAVNGIVRKTGNSIKRFAKVPVEPENCQSGTVDGKTLKRTCVLKGTNSTLKCPLAISNTDSVQWFKNGQLHSEGPLQSLIDASTEHDANYTCRVSNKFGSEKVITIEVIVDGPPTRRKNIKSYNIIKWDGGDDVINCGVDIFKMDVEIQWYYNGMLMEGQDSIDLNFFTWGNYTCKVSNFFGTVTNHFLVTSKDCLIDMAAVSSKNMPLILNKLSELSNFVTKQHHITISHGNTLTLFCNGFKGFSGKKEIKASCFKEDQYVVDNEHRIFSDFYCNAKMNTQTEESDKTCAKKNTKLIKIGFNTGKFVEILESCYDTDKKVPVFTKTIISNPKFKMYQDSELSYQTFVYGEYDKNALKTEHSIKNSDCKYVKGLLTSVEDISFGLAQKAVLEKQDLNEIFYLSCNNNSNWRQMEETIRTYIAGNRDDSGFTIWSGASKYESANKIWVPRYMWKVIKTLDSTKSLAIVTVNHPHYSESDRLCGKKDLCNQSWISELGDWPIYCCHLPDFSKAFNIPDDIFAA